MAAQYLCISPQHLASCDGAPAVISTIDSAADGTAHTADRCWFTDAAADNRTVCVWGGENELYYLLHCGENDSDGDLWNMNFLSFTFLIVEITNITHLVS